MFIEIKSGNGSILYKIFAETEDLRLYMKKNPDKICEKMTTVFSVEGYKEYPETEIRKLTEEEIKKYLQQK